MPDPDKQSPQPYEALVAGASAVARGSEIDDGLGPLLAAAVAAVGGSSGAVSLQDPDRPAPELSLTVGLDAAGQAALVSAVADEGHPLTAAARDHEESRGPDTAAFPLIIGRGGIEVGLGAISVGWSAPHDLDDAEATFLRAVADLAAVAVDRLRLASTLAERSEWFERLAHTDPLTGLANMRTFRRVLELELARAGRQGGEVSVALFDVDDFGATNDAAGHEAGDDVLRSVAAVLGGSIRLVDTVARWGGDEFILVAPGSAGLTVARRVIDGIGDLPARDGRRISVSAGVATFPADGTDADALLDAARAAVERARAAGRGNVGTTSG